MDEVCEANEFKEGVMEREKRGYLLVIIGLAIFSLVLMMVVALAVPNKVTNAEVDEKSLFEKDCKLVTEKDVAVTRKYVQPQKDIIKLEDVLSIDLYLDTENQEYTCNAKGVSVINKKKSKNVVQVDVSVKEKEGQIDFFLTNNDGRIENNSVYTYLEDGIVFTSVYSVEEARFDSIQYKYEKGEMSEKDYQNERAIFSRRGVKEEISISSPENAAKELNNSKDGNGDKTTYATVELKWERYENDPHPRPLSYMRVDLYNYNAIIPDELIDTAYTDVNGCCLFEFQNDDSILEQYGYDLYIRVYPDGRTFEVGKNWLTSAFFYYYDSSIVYNVATGATIPFVNTIEYDENNSDNCAFYLAQGLVVGETFLGSMVGYYPSDSVKIWYPFPLSGLNQLIEWVNDTFDASVSAIDESEGFAFCYRTCMGLTYDNFNKWDVLIHEYGHYVEDYMNTFNISLLEYLIFNPEHSINEDDVDEHVPLWNIPGFSCKEYGLNLAWTEAWATAFSLVAQDYYNSHIMCIEDIPNVANTYDENEDCETIPQNHMMGGEANELAIVGLLWDLYDSGTEELDATFNLNDIISLGATQWWAATTVSGTYTLSDFANILNNEYKSYRNGIGMLMEYYKFAPGKVNTEDLATGQALSSSDSIRFSWQANGRPNSPNNQFAIAVYNSSGTQLWISGAINTIPYTLTSSDWDSIRSVIGEGNVTLQLAVLGFNEDVFETGPYWSKIWSISLINPYDISSGTDYAEFTGTSLLGISIVFYVRFNHGGTKVIQTFGPRDTKMEIKYLSNVLIASDNDSGYNKNALISLNATAGEVYKISVRFKSILTIGTFKVAITSAPSVNNYESIEVLSPSVPSIEVTVASWYSRIFTYTSATTGSHRIFTAKAPSGSILTNTVLYIIDPRSPDEGYLYNDNGGNNGLFYSSITHTFDAGVPYLVIASRVVMSNSRTFLLCNE